MSAKDPIARRPAVAGLFYPADPTELARTVDDLLAAAPRWDGPRPKALIVPHAGYQYSGPVAATGYAALAAHRASVRRVVLLGPAHRAALSGIAVPVADVFLTPLGTVPVDDACRTAALAYGAVADDWPHAGEHSLEVHLPFIQRIFGSIPVLPLVVGEARPEAVAAVLEALWGEDGTIVIVSSDLSHYLDHHAARQADAATAAAILRRDWRALSARDACGFFPLRGLLEVAERRRMAVRQLDLRTSGDTAGDRTRVVGYGTFALFEVEQGGAGLTAEEQRVALSVAEGAIRGELNGRQIFAPAGVDVPQGLRRPGSSFITLERGARLLGCRGTMEARRPLVEDIAVNAVLTAFQDPRFRPISRDDFSELSLKVSVLSPLEATGWSSYGDAVRLVRPGVDGLLVSAGSARATLLPSVWAHIPEPARFLAALWEKAGMPPGSWLRNATVQRYTTEEFTSYGPRDANPDS